MWQGMWLKKQSSRKELRNYRSMDIHTWKTNRSQVPWGWAIRHLSKCCRIATLPWSLDASGIGGALMLTPPCHVSHSITPWTHSPHPYRRILLFQHLAPSPMCKKDRSEVLLRLVQTQALLLYDMHMPTHWRHQKHSWSLTKKPKSHWRRTSLVNKWCWEN
jgi:hypothetical protein